MATLNASEAEIRVWVHPIDPDAAFRSPCAVSLSFAALLSPDNGDSAGTPATGTPSTGTQGGVFAPVEWQGQSAFKSVQGPLQFVRLRSDGVAQFGVRAAPESKPDEEVCGFTLRPKVTRLHSTIPEGASVPGSGDIDLRPELPEGEPVLEWVAEQGAAWEREISTRRPLHCGIRHAAALANRTIKAKTKANWPQNAGLAVVLDLGGVAYEHVGQPALRFEFGGRYSLVLRGIGKDVHPVLERRSSNASGTVEWKVWRTLENAPALTEDFWRTRHEVVFYRLSGMLIVTWNGTSFWVGEAEGNDNLRPITWKAAPLRLSVYGADVLLKVSRVEFDVEASFTSETPTSEPPSSPVPFEIEGSKIHSFPAGNATAKAKMHGMALEESRLQGTWELSGGAGVVSYEVTLQGTKEEPPLLCAFAAQFPPTAHSPAPQPVDLRPALNHVEIESGQPDTLPSSEARIGVSSAMLERFIEDWESAILPFRPVHIETNAAGDWETLFRGYLLPESVSSDGFNRKVLELVARDPKVRLRAPAALVDGRYGPLDLVQEDEGEAIYGAQCAKRLIGLELGSEWAADFNGTGNPFRFIEPDHYPLKGGPEGGYFLATQTPDTGAFNLPPPFGEDIERWIDQIAGFDHAVWFYDPREGNSGAWVYGDLFSLFAARSASIYTLHDTTGGMVGDSIEDWPLLSRYAGESVLESAFTQVQVWGAAPEGSFSSFKPSLYTGQAGSQPDAFSIDPLSENQSWRRTLLVRQDFIGRTAFEDYAESLAWRIWSEFEGRAPQKWEFTLEDQILTARWGERVNFGPNQLRIVRVRHSFAFDNGAKRTTEITARALSVRGI